VGNSVNVGNVGWEGNTRHVGARGTSIIYGTYITYIGGFSRGEDGCFSGAVRLGQVVG
jgi:hypothetical protein